MIEVDPSRDGEQATSTATGAASGEARGSRSADPGASEAFASLGARLLQDAEEIGAYFKLLLATRADRARLRAREAALRAAGVAAALLALSALLVTAVVLVTSGLAGALTELTGGRAWLGELATGALLLTALALGSRLAARAWRRRQLERNRRKYDELERAHHARFGSRAPDAAAAPAQRA